MILVSNIEYLLLERGISQYEFAKKINLSYGNTLAICNSVLMENIKMKSANKIGLILDIPMKKFATKVNPIYIEDKELYKLFVVYKDGKQDKILGSKEDAHKYISVKYNDLGNIEIKEKLFSVDKDYNLQEIKL